MKFLVWSTFLDGWLTSFLTLRIFSVDCSGFRSRAPVVSFLALESFSWFLDSFLTVFLRFWGSTERDLVIWDGLDLVFTGSKYWSAVSDASVFVWDDVEGLFWLARAVAPSLVILSWLLVNILLVVSVSSLDLVLDKRFWRE